jgi:hypothetical protein
MIADRMQKCSAAERGNLLFESGILQIVLSYVGVGQHLYVRPVSRWWKESYATLESQSLTIFTGLTRNTIICTPQMTLCSSVFASPATVRLAYNSGLACTSEAFHRVAGEGADIETLAAARSLGMECTAATLTAAAECNKLAEVQYLRSQGCPWPAQLLDGLDISGRFELVRWCYEHGCPWTARSAACHATASGNVELMAWVLQQPGTLLSEHVMLAAAKLGHTALCQYLRSQQCPRDNRIITRAALDGKANLLRCLVESGCSFDLHALIDAAAKGGSVQVLTYLQQEGFLASATICTSMLDTAAVRDKLAAAQWLRANGAQWPTAFRKGSWSTAILGWARAQGCTRPDIQ